jgi:energy-coupling factor transport system permease protein
VQSSQATLGWRLMQPSAGLDARTKLLWIATVLILAFTATGVAAQLTLAASVILIVGSGIALGRLTLPPFLVVVRTLLPLITAIIILQGFFHSGMTRLLEIPILNWHAVLTLEGLSLGAALALRLFTISTAFAAFSTSTKPLDISLALHRLRVSYKFCMLVGMALQFFPDALRLVRDIENSQAARGFDPTAGSMLKRLKNFGPILVPLVIILMRRAVDMAIALELKGFSRKGRVYFLDETPASAVDRLLWLVLPVATLLAIPLLR